MGAFIARQPNGKLCRFSSIVDCPTDWNMTEEDYIKMCENEARIEAQKVLANNLKPFELVKELFAPHIMSQKEFEYFLKEVEK